MRRTKKDEELTKEIISIVSKFYNVDVTEDSKRREVSTPRTITALMIKKLAPNVDEEYIAKQLNRKRSNINIMVNKMIDIIPFDKPLRKEINEVEMNIIAKSKLLEHNKLQQLFQEVYNKIYDLSIEELAVLKYKLDNNTFKIEDNLRVEFVELE